jgi:Protein of unknown function (DUF1552)
MIPLSSRRTFIKGLPVGLAGLAASSPFWDRLITRALAQEAAKKRFLIWFVPDGLVPEWFWHDTAGPLTIRSDRAQDAELSGTSFSTTIAKTDWPTFVLQPLASYASQILLAKGVNNAGTADHVTSIQSALTGEEIGTKGSAGGPSIDVIAGDALKTSSHIVPVFRTGVYVKQTKLTGAGAPFHEKDGQPFIEPSSSITTDARVMLDAVGGRATSTTPAPTTPTMSGPSAAELKSKTRIAALGAVKARVEAMRCAAGTPAANRLEAYIADVARLEALESQAGGSTGGMTSPFTVSPTLDPNDAAVKTNEGDIHHLPDVAPFLRELAVTALALDYAPVVTLQWGATGVNKISGNTLTDYRYDFLPNFENKGAGEHGLAHPQNDKFIAAGFNISGQSSTRDRVRMRRWVFNQLKLVLDRLAETQDGGGSLLDNTTILYASEFGGPNANSPGGQHSNRDLPYMLIGGKNSPFKLGQGLNVNRSHGDYLLTVAKGLGSTVNAVGRGTSPIDGILK